MTSLRHYHLGCGESLHSSIDYMHERGKQQRTAQVSKGSKKRMQTRQGKKH